MFPPALHSRPWQSFPPQSARAPAALYNLGLLNERASKNAAARDAYQRVVQSYPKSDEAALARDRLKALGR